MAKQTKAEIKLNTDVYLNDSVPIRSIKPSYINEIITDLLDSYIHYEDVVDNLTSTLTEVPLSAHQGKILNDKILAMAGSLIPQGAWDASNNTPDISGETQTGKFWIVSVDGATDIGGITDWKANDWVVKTASGWAKVDNTDKVTSVNGEVGDVDLNGTYLPLTGGTLTGQLNANGGVKKSNTEGRGFNLTDTNISLFGSSIAGWSRAFSFKDYLTGGDLGGFGASGASGVLTSWYIGKDYNDNTFSVDANNGQLTLTEQLNANSGVVVDQGSGLKSILTGYILEFQRADSNVFKASSVGGKFTWQVNGNTNNVMILNNNGQLNLTEQLNANGGVVITKQGDGEELLKLNAERSWSFYQQGTGAGSSLLLGDNSGSKLFKIGRGIGNKEISTLFSAPAQGVYAKLQTWKGSDVNNTDVAFIDTNGVGSFNGGVIAPSITNNSIQSKRYRYELSGQTFSTINTTSYPLSNFGFSGDWKKLSVISVVVFDNSETLNVDCASLGIEYQIDQYNVSLADINLTKLNGLSTFTNHRVVLIIEENI